MWTEIPASQRHSRPQGAAAGYPLQDATPCRLPEHPCIPSPALQMRRDVSLLADQFSTLVEEAPEREDEPDQRNEQ